MHSFSFIFYVMNVNIFNILTLNIISGIINCHNNCRCVVLALVHTWIQCIYEFVCTFFSFHRYFTSFFISCNSKTSADTFCEWRSTPGLINTSQLSIGFGLPPSLMQASVSSEFSLTGTKMFPASKRRESISRYGGFGRSVKKTTKFQFLNVYLILKIN